MMINGFQPIYNPSKASAPQAPQANNEASSSSASAQVSDQADINFSASLLSSKAESLLAATSSEAAALKGNIGEHEPGEIIVRTKPGFELNGENSISEDFGAKVLHQFNTKGGIFKNDGGEFMHLKLPAGVSTEEAMAAMAKDERVLFAVPNHTYGLPEVIPGNKPEAASTDSAPVNDPQFGKLYGMHNEGQTGGKVDADIDAPEAWNIHTGRNQAEGGPLIAVIDTGIDYNHVDLKANVWVNPNESRNGNDDDGNGIADDIHGYSPIDNNGDPIDRHGHGSHVMGTIAAVGNNGEGVVGVNHKANVMGVKIFNDQGRTNAAAIIKGIQYSTDMGARITNNSWGGGMPNEGIKEAFAQSPAMHIVAAGNERANNDVRGSYPANYDLPNIISVAATDHNDNLARFSNYGAKKVHIGAPGVDILSTVPGDKYASYSGTSMASPMVAGAAGLIVSAYPDITNEQLRERLLGGTDAIESLQGKTTTGGRLNVNNAIQENFEKTNPQA